MFAIPAKIDHFISMDLGWSRIFRDNGTFGTPVAEKIRHSFWGLHYERCRCTLLIRPWNVFEKLKGEKLPGTKHNNQRPRAMFVTFQNHQVLRLFQGVYYFLLYRDNYIKKRTPWMDVTCFHSRASEREWTNNYALFAGADLVPGCFLKSHYGWIIFWIHHICASFFFHGQKWPGSFWRNLPFLNRSFYLLRSF